MTTFTKEVQGLKEKLVEAQTERDEAKKQMSSHSESLMIMKKNLKEKVHTLALVWSLSRSYIYFDTLVQFVECHGRVVKSIEFKFWC